MDKHNTEIFGEFTYAERLTYETLLAYESLLLENLDNIFLEAGAEHLDFTPQGDILRFQCAFESRNLEILRDIAQEITAILPPGVRGKLLCLEKDLSLYNLFWLQRGQWQEKEYILPTSAPDGSPVHKIVLPQ